MSPVLAELSSFPAVAVLESWPAAVASAARAPTESPTWPRRVGELTYAEVGATQRVLPSGYQHLERMRTVGRGADDFHRAAEAVMRWGVQRGAGLRVEAGCDRATQGCTVTVRLGVGPLAVRAPCLVVFTIDEPRRRGFAYGTLPGHPECGEELFLVEHRVDDTVRLTIRAFSRPTLWWSRASGPAGRLAQRAITARCLRALSR